MRTRLSMQRQPVEHQPRPQQRDRQRGEGPGLPMKPPEVMAPFGVVVHEACLQGPAYHSALAVVLLVAVRSGPRTKCAPLLNSADNYPDTGANRFGGNERIGCWAQGHSRPVKPIRVKRV